MHLHNMNVLTVFILFVLHYGDSTPIDAQLEIDLTNQTTIFNCPNNQSGLFVDDTICNIYHECSCVATPTQDNEPCTILNSYICPDNYIFLNEKKQCVPIETSRCETTYLQLNDSRVTMNETKEAEPATVVESVEEVESKKIASLRMNNGYTQNQVANDDGSDHFKCPPGANNRYADSLICNIFHVCVTKGEQTYDQPFLCPYSSIFRVVNATHMYCDKRRYESDCIGKAFYKDANDENKVQLTAKLLLSSTKNATLCYRDDMIEDPVYCNVYHRCANGLDELYMCENQLLYNPQSTLCDYPINVVCDGKQILKRGASNKTEAVELTPEPFKKSEAEPRLQQQSQPQKEVIKERTLPFFIYGVKIDLNCPVDADNALLADPKFCNVFHHCHSGSGNVFVCDKEQAFDTSANGPNSSGVCNFEDSVDCFGKFILTENGIRAGKMQKINTNPRIMTPLQQQFNSYHVNSVNEMNTREDLVKGITFDCHTKPTGHWRDGRFCDIYHACMNGEQRKTYKCAQMSERVYFDEQTRRCEFVRNNPMACRSNQYYQTVTVIEPQQAADDTISDVWKQFIRGREHFSCAGRADGFFSSRWCNVFYRCYLGVKTEFLCPKMQNTDRLWWLKHSTAQDTAQTSASCGYPCESKAKCSSPGGLVTETAPGTFSESSSDIDRLFRNCDKTDAKEEDIFKVPDTQFSCAGLEDGSFHSSKYCNVFHRCASGKRKDFMCPKATNSPYELWWNEEKQQCEWPCLVKCTKPVFGTQKTAMQVQNQDALFNEDLCKDYTPTESSQSHTIDHLVPTNTFKVTIMSKTIQKPFPDETFVCLNVGLFISPRICNVYYECKNAGQQPINAYYCENGYFDGNSKSCKSTDQTECSYSPSTLYPIVSIPETTIPEDVLCTSFGYHLINSNKYCNMYYLCDGKSLKPKAYRCYDRVNMEDGVYNREQRQCETVRKASCRGEFYSQQQQHPRQRYQSIPIDVTRLPELQTLSCKADQQYLAEHEKYCNLYHSCILGRYQVYACVTTSGFDRTSYFYYTNGDCGSPSPQQCTPNKSILSYERIVLSAQQQSQQPYMSPSIAQSGETLFGFMPLKSSLDSLLECESSGNYIIPHKRYCNLFYECNGGKLKINVCVDKTTNALSGIFDKTTGKCKPYNNIDCPSGLVYNPNDSVDDLSPSAAATSSRQIGRNQQKSNFLQVFSIPSFVTGSSFSCVERPNGYYESEWCNVFFRCVNGKRIDVRCSTGYKSGDVPAYDLWWEHQNVTYDPLNPRGFLGADEEARCEFPCKVKCNKQIWSLNDRKVPAEAISQLDARTHNGCVSSGPKDTALPNSASAFQEYRPYETDNVNPSGYFCDRDGTFKDPIFCNILHVCFNKQRKTFICKKSDTDGTGATASIYDVEQNVCVSRGDGNSKCQGVIYDPNYMVLPVYKNLPATSQGTCEKSGVSRVQDGSNIYCDLFYWCEKANSEPVFFHCNNVVFGKGTAYYNHEKKQCDSEANVYCPFPNKLYMANAPSVKSQFEDVVVTAPANLITVNAGQQQNPYMMQILEGLMDPAPGFRSLSVNQFQTSFTCSNRSAGYYANPEYCDVFHYCYTNSQYRTYVCAPMQNRYQLWWNHQSDSGKRGGVSDNLFCDWPCSSNRPKATVCPSHKRVYMRDRQHVSGGVTQKEVLDATCPSTKPEQAVVVEAPQQQQQQRPVSDENEKSPLSYKPCTHHTDEWYASPAIIRCTAKDRMNGFVQDPKDCSKYYRCDSNIGLDSLSNGYLMSCIAGLWWDQGRKLCASPKEVSCDPYKIITNQGFTIQATTASPVKETQQSSVNTVSSSSSKKCKVTCVKVGMTSKQLMKSISGHPNGFYKCDGQCAIEMACPLDLIFDDDKQQCEWPQPQRRLASLRMIENVVASSNEPIERNDTTTTTMPIVKTTDTVDRQKNNKKIKLSTKIRKNLKI